MLFLRIENKDIQTYAEGILSSILFLQIVLTHWGLTVTWCINSLFPENKLTCK